MSVAMVQAQTGDLDEVLALLRDVALPVEGVEEHFGQSLVARDGRRLVGCVGLERYVSVALLRSLAVAPDRQRDGLGRQLTARLLEDARSSGVREVALLTTTAADFFARHFGFTPAERKSFDETLAASPEWHLPRCSSAACLHLRLGERSRPSKSPGEFVSERFDDVLMVCDCTPESCSVWLAHWRFTGTSASQQRRKEAKISTSPSSATCAVRSISDYSHYL